MGPEPFCGLGIIWLLTGTRCTENPSSFVRRRAHIRGMKWYAARGPGSRGIIHAVQSLGKSFPLVEIRIERGAPRLSHGLGLLSSGRPVHTKPTKPLSVLRGNQARTRAMAIARWRQARFVWTPR